jgi:hypothetical protein
MKRSGKAFLGAAGALVLLSGCSNNTNCPPQAQQPGTPNQAQCAPSSSSSSSSYGSSFGARSGSSSRTSMFGGVGSFFGGSSSSSSSSAVSSVTRGGFGSFARSFGSFGG